METRWQCTFRFPREAQIEAKEIMASDKNILKPGSGNIVISVDKLDIVLGSYWMNQISSKEKKEKERYCYSKRCDHRL